MLTACLLRGRYPRSYMEPVRHLRSRAREDCSILWPLRNHALVWHLMKIDSIHFPCNCVARS